jgi:hypothetical protein
MAFDVEVVAFLSELPRFAKRRGRAQRYEHRLLVPVRNRVDSCEANMGIDCNGPRVATATDDVGDLRVVTAKQT